LVLACDKINSGMDSETSPPVRAFLPTAIFLAIIGWAGLVILFINTLPTVGPRWLFFFLSVLALTGTSLPFIAYLNLRFPSMPPPGGMAIVRQSLWIGIYSSTLAWLQIGRVLTPTLAVLLAVGIGLIEFLLRLSERSQWKP
jgi:hypothetical protein